MIDPNAPLMLDDGTPVTRVSKSDSPHEASGLIYVELPPGKAWRRNGKHGQGQGRHFWYRISDGVWSGASKKTGLYLVNRDDAADFEMDEL